MIYANAVTFKPRMLVTSLYGTSMGAHVFTSQFVTIIYMVYVIYRKKHTLLYMFTLWMLPFLLGFL
jgi:hypothetical protein